MSDGTHAGGQRGKQNWIYAIGVATSPTGPVKIGRTTNVEQRLYGIQRDMSLLVPEGLDRNSLTVLYSTAADAWVERRLHAHFRRYRLCGEWFALNPAVVAREVRMAISEIVSKAGHTQRKRVQESPAPKPSPTRECAHEAVAEAPSAMTAKQHLTLFNGWVDAGFTEEQALRMVVMLTCGMDRHSSN